MSQDPRGAELLRAEIGRHDWSKVKSFLGDGSMLPNAIQALVFARSDEQARAAYWNIDNVAIVQGRLSESVVPLTSCLLAGLPVANEFSRPYVLDLLAVIATGYDDHVDSDRVGPISVRDCVREMALQLPIFVDETLQRCNPSCVDILLMCATYDGTVRGRVSAVFQEALQSPACASIRDLISNSLADLG
jgi:hypothetical protein